MHIKVFFDTEFTDLDPGAQLISIGLVSEPSLREGGRKDGWELSGDSLYVEIEDWDRTLASDFVKEVVVPLLGRPVLPSLREGGR